MLSVKHIALETYILTVHESFYSGINTSLKLVAGSTMPIIIKKIGIGKLNAELHPQIALIL